MANDKRRQKKAQQAKKKRDLAKKEARKRDMARSSPGLALKQLSPSAAFGPTYVSSSLNAGEGTPELVTVVVSRKVPGLGTLCGVFMIDRTCLGVKDGYLMPFERLPMLLERSREVGQTMVEAEPLLAQSVVFHALDYAERLGFSPHPDAPLAMLQPRPPTLLDTPLCNVPKPLYINGPHDDPQAIIAQLTRVCGPGNFDFLAGGPGLARLLEMLPEDDEEDEDEDITAEGEEIP